MPLILKTLYVKNRRHRKGVEGVSIPNSEYWAKRFTELEKKQHQNSVEFYNQVKEEFDKAQAQIQKELDVFFSRFAENNNISLNEAKKILNDKELKEFKWTVEEYIQKGRENAVNGKWINQLENASTRWRISRLESLQIQLQQQAEILFGNYADEFDKFIIDTYKNERLRTAYEIQRGINVGSQITGIDEDKLKIMINKPWTVDGENFSMRIWRSKSQLINELNTQLIQGCILGHSVDKMSSQLAGLTKAFDTDFQKAKSQSARLINTESAYFSTLSRKNTFQELDVEEFEIVATLDRKTSEICQDMDGRHFPVSQMQVGVNAPPFHVNCRTTTIPYFDDEFTVNDMRIARGEDGKTYYVPSNMTYKEWEEKFVLSKT